MKPQLFLLFISGFIMIQINAQESSSKLLLRSTIGVSGSSEHILLDNKLYLIQQTFGQQSVIGTFKNNNCMILQGFIQPKLISKIMTKGIPLTLSLDVYPNPFTEFISILFHEEITSEIFIEIFNMRGSLVFSRSYPANQNIKIMFGREIIIATYVLKVRINNKQSIRKIIKTL